VSGSLGGSLVTGRAPTRTVNSSKALGVVGSPWVAVCQRSGDGRQKLGLRWGKLLMEAAGAAIYGERSPGWHRATTLTLSRMESKIESEFVWI
jgi:hypothetical protein